MRHRTSFFGALALTLLVQCSLFTSLDGLSPDPEGDAGSPAPGSGDVSQPTVLVDGGGADATLDGARLTFCSSQPAGPLCEDWDQTGLGTWSFDVLGAGKVELAPAGRSAPYALASKVPEAGVLRYASVKRQFSRIVGHVRLSYALRIEERPSTDEYEVNILRFGADDGSTTDYYLAITAGGARYFEQRFTTTGGSTQPLPIPLSIPTGVWTWITIEVDTSGSGPKRITIAINDADAGTAPLVGAPGRPTVQAGITYANPAAGEGSVLIDDLTFEQF